MANYEGKTNLAKNKLGKICSDFRTALNEIGYTCSNLNFEPGKARKASDVHITVTISKLKKKP